MSKVLPKIVLLCLIPAVGTAGEPRDWSYKYFKEDVPLTLDAYRIAILDPTPESAVGPAPSMQEVPGQEGSQPVGSIGAGWELLDLSGQPSGGDPVAVEALIEAFATDPMDDKYAAPIFVEDGITMYPASEILIGFEEEVAMAAIEQILADAGLGAIITHDWLKPNTFIVDGNTRSGIVIMDTANTLALRPEVVFATAKWGLTSESFANVLVEYPPELVSSIPSESSRILASFSRGAPAPLCESFDGGTPNDPRLGESWGLDAFNDIDIDAGGAWALCTGDPATPVAVIGDGVQRDHPDMPNVLEGADFTDECLFPPCIGEPQTSCDNHETSVASIIHATINNGLQSAGVAPDTSILPVRSAKQIVLPNRCFGQLFQDSLANGVNYAVEQGARVISLSWQVGNIGFPSVEIAFEEAYDAGVVVINSAGNNNQPEVGQPGRLFEIQSVTGIDSSGELFYVSETFASNYGAHAAFTAPARFVFALDRTGADGYADSNDPLGADATLVTGTSFAAPHIAAIATLIIATNEALDAEGVHYILKSTVMDLGPSGRDDFFGAGLGKAEAAVNLAPSVITIRDFDRGDLSGWSGFVGN